MRRILSVANYTASSLKGIADDEISPPLRKALAVHGVRPQDKNKTQIVPRSPAPAYAKSRFKRDTLLNNRGAQWMVLVAPDGVMHSRERYLHQSNATRPLGSQSLESVAFVPTTESRQA